MYSYVVYCRIKSFTSEKYWGIPIFTSLVILNYYHELLATTYKSVLFSNLWRTTSEEKRELERLQKPMYNSVRRAAEVHRQV
jgi:hypothetical protein